MTTEFLLNNNFKQILTAHDNYAFRNTEYYCINIHRFVAGIEKKKKNFGATRLWMSKWNTANVEGRRIYPLASEILRKQMTI